MTDWQGKADRTSFIVILIIILSFRRRHGDSGERGDSHDRLTKRRHGDSGERGNSHDRLARRRHGDSGSRGRSNDRLARLVLLLHISY